MVSPPEKPYATLPWMVSHVALVSTVDVQVWIMPEIREQNSTSWFRLATFCRSRLPGLGFKRKRAEDGLAHAPQGLAARERGFPANPALWYDFDTMTREYAESAAVRSFLETLASTTWFTRVGQPLETDDVVQVMSLDEAWAAHQEDAWINAPFHDVTAPSHPVWALAYDRAYDAVAASGRNYELEPGNPIARAAAWDSGCAAYQLATGREDGFYLTLMRWYRKGHWPCGWRGAYPEGRLVVY